MSSSTSETASPSFVSQSFYLVIYLIYHVNSGYCGSRPDATQKREEKKILIRSRINMTEWARGRNDCGGRNLRLAKLDETADEGKVGEG